MGLHISGQLSNISTQDNPGKKTTVNVHHRPILIVACVLVVSLLWGDAVSVHGTRPGSSIEPVVIQTGVGRYRLGNELYFFFDHSSSLDIGQVVDLDEALFQPDGSDVPSFGYSDAIVWGRVAIMLEPSNRIEETQEWFLEVGYPLFDEVSLYIVQGDRAVTSATAGDRLPFSTRKINYRNPIFPLELEPGVPVELYLSISSGGPVHFPVYLWSTKNLVEQVSTEQYVFGIYYGIMIVMIFYNMFLFLSVRDRAYLYYVLYITAITGMHGSINGFTFQYFWPEFPYLANQSTLFFIGLMQLGMALFTRTFLDTQVNTPRLDVLLRVFIAQALLVIGASLLGLYGIVLRFANLAIMLEIILVFSAGIISWRNGYHPARYFTLAMSSFLAGGLVFSLKVPGILPATLFTTYAIQIGSALEVSILAFALADRINVERRDKLRAQETAIAAQEKAVHELQRVDRLKDSFLANTSHELRTPLHGIIGLAESMQHRLPGTMSSGFARNLAMIAESGRRLARLVDDILDFSQIRDGDIVLNVKPLDMAILAEHVVRYGPHLIGENPIVLQNQIPPDLAPAAGDEDRIQQILYNLVGNAVKFTERGTIVIGGKQIDDTLEISVADSGIGIEAERLDSLFESFSQDGPANEKSHAGFGLGLAISRRLVALHGGKIWAESSPGSGSTFFFTLPVADKPADQWASPRPVIKQSPSGHQMLDTDSPGTLPAPVSSLQTGSADKSVVWVVDDDRVNRQVIMNHLAFTNVETRSFSDGASCLEALAGGSRPDLVLLDIMMPQLSGYEVCFRLRQQYDSSVMPVVMLTAKDQISDIVQGFAAGANDYLTKPFSGEELLMRVQTHLKLRQGYVVLRENLSLRKELSERKKSLLELELSSLRLGRILDHVEEPLLVFNESGEIAYMNIPCRNILGVELGDMVGLPVSDVFDQDSMQALLSCTARLAVSDSVGKQAPSTCELPMKTSGDGAGAMLARLQLIEVDDEHLFLLGVQDADIQDMGSGPLLPISVIDTLNRCRAILRQVEDSLGSRRSSETRVELITGGLGTVDAALESLGRSLVAGGQQADQNRLGLEVMQLAVDLWTKTTGRTRADLARESGLWQVYTNRDGWERTQTLDRYLDTSRFPRRPRIGTIIATADYVLARCDTASNLRDRLLAGVAALRAMR